MGLEHVSLVERVSLFQRLKNTRFSVVCIEIAHCYQLVRYLLKQSLCPNNHYFVIPLSFTPFGLGVKVEIDLTNDGQGETILRNTNKKDTLHSIRLK